MSNSASEKYLKSLSEYARTLETPELELLRKSLKEAARTARQASEDRVMERKSTSKGK